jgi:hypothetical protein
MPNRWTEEEIKVLKKFYSKKGANYVARFVEHSPDTVMFKAAQLGLRTNKFRKWEKWEDNYLERHHHDRSYASIAKTLKRTKKSVLHRACQLKLTNKRSEYWNQEDLERLAELYPNRNYTLKEIGAMLNRSAVSVMIKARRMKINRDDHIYRWTKRDHNYLLKNMGEKTNREIAEHLGIKTYKVNQYIIRQGLTRYKKKPEWTDEEREFLRSNYKKLTIKEIAMQFDRTVMSIKNTASRMGLSPKDSKPWSGEEEKYLKDNYLKLNINQLSETLKRGKSSVAGKIRRMGLSKRRKPVSKSGSKSKIQA